MIFSREDFKIDSAADFISFMLILPFVGLILPFLGAAYTLGFFMDLCGWLDT